MRKVVITFSGTKSTEQLLSEMWNSNGEHYFRNPESNVMIMKYFQIHLDFFKGLKKAKHHNIEQYIFVGHSLGGAMASIALFDAVTKRK